MRNKFHAKKVIFDGQTFDSKKEMYRYQELSLLQKAKKIESLERQVKYVLIPAQRDENGKLIERECSYIADFVYNEGDKVIVEDVKGIRTKEYTIKRKLMLYLKGIRIREV